MAASATIGALRVVLGLDTAQFEKGLTHAQEKLGSVDLGKGLLQGIKSAEGGLEELAGKLGGLGASLGAIGGIGLAAAAALGGIAEALHKTEEAIGVAAGFAKLSAEVGVSTDFIQKFNFAARQSDIDVATADQALKQFNTSLGLVQSGLARSLTTKAFAALGFTPEQLRGFKDAGDLFPVLAERIANTGSAAEQAAIAKRLGLEALLPLLKDGAAGFSKLAQEAEDLGLVMDAGLIRASKEAEDKLRALDDVTKAQANRTFAEFAETLITVKTAFADAERAGLSFLAFLTGTGSLDGRIKKLQGIQTDDALNAVRNGTDPSKDRELQAATAELRGLRLKQTILDFVGPGAESTKPRLATSLVPGGDDKKAGQLRLASLEAINAAQKSELEAEQALVGNIRELAALRLKAVDAETKAANDKLAEQARDGKITGPAAETAKAANDARAVAQKALVLRQRDAALAEQAVQEEGELNGYTQRAAAVRAQFAGSASERARIEAAALTAQQKLERDELAAANGKKIAEGKLTILKALEYEDEQKIAQISEAERQKRQAAVAIVEETVATQRAALDSQAALLESQGALLKSSTARADVEAKILAIKQKEEEDALKAQIISGLFLGYSQERIDALKKQLADLQGSHANDLKLLQSETRLVDRMQEAADAVSGLKDAFARHDWSGILDQMQRTLETVTSAFANKGVGGGLGTLGAIAASAIGGKAGGALNTGITAGVGVAGLATALGSIGGTLGLAAAGTFAGSLATGLLTASAFLGPLAPIIGIVAGLATLFTNTKPSNFTASAAFNGTTGATFGGDKPNDATTNLAQQAASALLTAEQTLTAAGVNLGTTVKGLEIGQRDLSKITLSNGQVLTSAVGDASAAVDTALKAVLRGAQFTDAAEQKLVSSLLDAGKGFDDIVTALNNYQAAQAALAPIADAILQLTDPQAFDLKKVRDGIDQQRAAFKAAADAGYITADQLTQVNAQLDKLQGLQIDQVLAKTAQAAQTAADAAVSGAKDALSRARDAEATALQAQIDKYSQVVEGLDAFLQSLDQATSSPATANLGQLGKAFDNIAKRAQLGDADAGGQLAGVASQFKAAGLAQAHTAQEAKAIEDKIRAGVTAAADTAKRQVSVAQQQLDQLNATVDQLLEVNQTLLSVKDAIDGLAVAQAAASGAYAAALSAAQAGPNVTAGVSSPTPDVTGPTLVTDTNPGTMDLPTAMDFQARALASIAKSTDAFAEFADQWTNGGGIPTVAA